MTNLIPRIGPVCYREPANFLPGATAPFTVKPLNKRDGQPLYWLDELCRGSIKIPNDLDVGADPRGRSLIMLLTGPPGSGKSTFALELCCSLVKEASRKVFYVSTEESAKRIEEKACDNGWIEEGQAWICSDRDGERGRELPAGGLVVKGRETRVGPELDPATCGGAMSKQSPPDEKPLEGISQCFSCTRGVQNFFTKARPVDVLVLDSLNMYSPDPEGHRSKIAKFNEIQHGIADPSHGGKNPALIILVIDTSERTDEESLYCEFCADILFRFGWEQKLRYTLRTFEIVKMRGQSHAWGKQRVKIYRRDKDKLFAQSENPPYLHDKGGIFIFPSMHTYISHFGTDAQAPFHANPDGQPLSFPGRVADLNKQISSHVPAFQGVPAGGCTALIGPRGAMKSHLAYYFLLAHASGLLGDNAESASDTGGHRNCLLVSFRDDQDGAVQTLAHIAESQALATSGNGMQFVQKLIQEDRLEILVNDIGMISPEEFFHNIYVAVHRPRQLLGLAQSPQQGGARVQMVLVNGLDQLEARFPLIAKEGMFVPALIQLLRMNKVCSMLISAIAESATPAGQSLYGLLPMADLVLCLESIDRHDPPAGYRWPNDFPDELWPENIQQISRIETRRVPGGQIGQRVGYLYRRPDGEFLYTK